MQWTVHGEESLYRDEWLDIRIADVELPDGRRIGHRLIRTPPGAGCVVVRDGQVLLLWRHRFITGSWTWEIPLGRSDPGEDLAHAAARETEEETGWRPGPLTPLLKVEPTAGLSDSVHHVYLADGAEQVGPPEDGYESSRIEWMDLADVPAVIGRGEISSGTTVAALMYAIAVLGAGGGRVGRLGRRGTRGNWVVMRRTGSVRDDPGFDLHATTRRARDCAGQLARRLSRKKRVRRS